jgi:hypothetical protein
MSRLQVPKKLRINTEVVYLSDWAQTDREGLKFGFGDLDWSDSLQFPRVWIWRTDWDFLSLFSHLKPALPPDTCSTWQPWSKCLHKGPLQVGGGHRGAQEGCVWQGWAERCFVELCPYFWNVWLGNCHGSCCWSSPNMVPTVILPWK